ncbi:MAG: hypothetical protein R3D56_04300 [Paracoccaceae bacterium]
MALKQQFIIDYLVEQGVDVPNSFFDADVVEKIERKGFELRGEANFLRSIQLTNAHYKNRVVAPIANCKANDDVIAFLISPRELGQIVVYHGFTEPGYERPVYYQTFTDWLDDESSAGGTVRGTTP